jgi:hypothetical protein
MKITVTIPLPPKYVSQNQAHRHWTKRGAAAKTYRERCAALFSVVPRMRPPIRVSTEWFLGRNPALSEPLEYTKGGLYYLCGPYYPRDAQNAVGSLKAAFDGLVDAGVVKSDAAANLTLGATVLHTTEKAHGGRSCVEVTIEGEPA